MRRAMDPFQFLLITVAGWMNQQQQHAIDFRGRTSGCFSFAPCRMISMSASIIDFRMFQFTIAQRGVHPAGNAVVAG